LGIAGCCAGMAARAVAWTSGYLGTRRGPGAAAVVPAGGRRSLAAHGDRDRGHAAATGAVGDLNRHLVLTGGGEANARRDCARTRRAAAEAPAVGQAGRVRPGHGGVEGDDATDGNGGARGGHLDGEHRPLEHLDRDRCGLTAVLRLLNLVEEVLITVSSPGAVVLVGRSQRLDHRDLGRVAEVAG